MAGEVNGDLYLLPRSTAWRSVRDVSQGSTNLPDASSLLLADPFGMQRSTGAPLLYLPDLDVVQFSSEDPRDLRGSQISLALWAKTWAAVASGLEACDSITNIAPRSVGLVDQAPGASTIRARSIAMLSRLFRSSPPKPAFPERVHLPHLTDIEATAALDLLRLLVARNEATVYQQTYTPAGEAPHRSVWINSALDAPGQSYALETWAISALFPSTAGQTDGE
jgi:hypothetical protein